jgi:uncharacterized protein (TIGR02246 family)
MKNVTFLPLAIAIALSVAQPASARGGVGSTASCEAVTEGQVAALFDRWNDSLQTGNPDKVVTNYASDGVLLATVSNQPRTTPAAIRDYFVKFLKGSPKGEINERFIKIGCDVAQDVGTYAFTFAGGAVVQARYT